MLLPYVVDGDTIRCGDRRVRLARIDAPELPGHCARGRHCAPGDGEASKAALERMIGGQTLSCPPVAASPEGGSVDDRWGRMVARCRLNGRDIGQVIIAGGSAVQWPHR
ncbi:thermonuclease family protein [Sphingomonas koreensis]|nr:thermonuclease family protein [Sphingomonas koreensis]